MFMRLLIPSWRFFDITGTIPGLYVRVLGSKDFPDQWIDILHPPDLHWHSLLFNPLGNLHHTLCNTLDNLIQHPEDQYSIEVIDQYVRYYLVAKLQCQGGNLYQFKVTGSNFDADQRNEEDLIISPETFL